MKITFHKKIAAFFGYEFTRINESIFQNQQKHTFELIKRLNIDLVLDVGANMGQFSTDIRRAGYDSKIISFEPINTCFEHLNSIADKYWQIENYALGDTHKNETINISNKTVYSSILDTSQFGKANFTDSIKTVNKQKIEIKRLDDIISSLSKSYKENNIFLKLDTQGYDSHVINGAIMTLQHVKMLQTEVSCKAIYEGAQPHYETLKQLSEIGFSITGIFPLSRDKNTMELLEFDCILIKSD